MAIDSPAIGCSSRESRVAGRAAVGQNVADVRFVDHLRAAVMVGVGQPDVDVDAHRLGDLGAQVLADGAAGDPANHLAEDEAER